MKNRSFVPLLVVLTVLLSFSVAHAQTSCDIATYGTCPPPMRFSFKALSDPFGYSPDDPLKTLAVPTYNRDGTLTESPVEFNGKTSHTYEVTPGDITINFPQSKLKVPAGECCDYITIGGVQKLVYSTVPESMTIQYGYMHPEKYLPDQAAWERWSTGINLTLPNGPINCGFPSSFSLGAGDKSASGSPVVVFSNDCPSAIPYSRYYLPFVPNGKGADDLTDLDHNGLTEHVVWSTNEYLKTPTNPSPLPVVDDVHLFQFGWAFDPRNVNQEIFWNNLDKLGQFIAKQFSLAKPGASEGNSLLWSIAGNYWCSKPAVVNCTRDKTKQITDDLAGSNHPFPDPTPWLLTGAFVSYNPMPGFQKNLVREYTPSGSFTVLNNTSGLFVRANGDVEIPLNPDCKAGDVCTPYPLVVQTWTKDQRFAVYNKTKGAITATNDSYPGDEVYYLGNTYLPGQVGVVTTWLNYPWISLKDGGIFTPKYNQNVGHQQDNRKSDGWLGLKNDLVEHVLAWNNTTTSNIEPDFIVGGQARKPYMFGAGENVLNASDIKSKQWPYPNRTRTDNSIQLEHANSFYLWRVPNDDGKQIAANKMYKASLYAFLPKKNDYVWLFSIGWEFQPHWNFADGRQPTTWTKGNDSHGAWVQTWDVNPDLLVIDPIDPRFLGFPGQNLSFSGNVLTLQGGAGLAIAMKVVRAIWNGTAVEWAEAPWCKTCDSTDPRKSTMQANALDQPDLRVQITGTVPTFQGQQTTIDAIKFLIVLDDRVTGVHQNLTAGPHKVAPANK